MTKEMERLKEIETRKAVLLTEVEARGEDGKSTATAERLKQIRTEGEALKTEEAEIRSRMDLTDQLKPGAVPQNRCGDKSDIEKRADSFRSTNRMVLPMFREQRSILATGKIAAPTGVSETIGDLPQSVSSIVDDVEAIDATGTGSWKLPYKKTDAAAADVTDGSAIGGTGTDYDYVTINPATWGVVDTISNQVAKMTNVNYATNVENSARTALRRMAKAKIVAAVLASALAETRNGIALDADYLRNVVLGFGSDESVGGGTKLYLTKGDLYTLGKVRGTNEKRALYDIKFTDENNGTITDGGLSVPFSINSSLTDGTQLYGQPKAIKMPMWGDYEVSTDEGGEYFAKNLMAVRGLATANADLAVYHGMQIIKQAAVAGK